MATASGHPFEPWMIGETVSITRPAGAKTPSKTTVGTLRAFEIRFTPPTDNPQGALVPSYHWITTGYTAWTQWLTADQFTVYVPKYD